MNKNRIQEKLKQVVQCFQVQKNQGSFKMITSQLLSIANIPNKHVRTKNNKQLTSLFADLLQKIKCVYDVQELARFDFCLNYLLIFYADIQIAAFIFALISLKNNKK